MDIPFEIRKFILEKILDGVSYKELRFQVLVKFKRELSKGTISKIWHCYCSLNSFDNRPRPGRPQTYDNREKKDLVREALKTPKKSLRALAQDPFVNPKGASYALLASILSEAGIVARSLG